MTAAATTLRARWRSALANQQQRNLVLVWALLLAVSLAATLLSPYFLTSTNLSNIVSQSVALLLVTMGQTYLMLSGGIDLSVGSTIGLVAALLAITVTPNPLIITLSILLAVAVGAAVGVVNGIIVTRLKVLPFIATLATLSVVQGIALQLRKTPPGILPREFSSVFLTKIGPVPLPVVILVVITVAAGLILRHAAFGRHLYAIGSNKEAARLSGYNVNRACILAYTICGAMAGLAGAFLMARTRAGDPLVGETFAFDSITAVIMGGVYLYGGRGSAYGSTAAVLVIAVLSNLLNLLGMSSHIQFIMKGSLLIGAVMLYHERQ